MATRYTIRRYVEGGYYHIFNRGNEKKAIFRDVSDYMFFLSLFNAYLSPPGEKENSHLQNNFHGRIHLLSFSLMPNHYHLCIRQDEERVVSEFCRCIGQLYGRYFNDKYQRVGHLFQERYRARLIESDSDLLHVTRYIHLNAKKLAKDIKDYPYSSFSYFCRGGEPFWLHVDHILEIFSSMFGLKSDGIRDAYKIFVETYLDEEDQYGDLGENAPKRPVRN